MKSKPREAVNEKGENEDQEIQGRNIRRTQRGIRVELDIIISWHSVVGKICVVCGRMVKGGLPKTAS